MSASRFAKSRAGILALAWAWAAAPGTAHACATCFGQSDSRMAVGMNWGIFALLVVVTCVLSAFACFFVYLSRRAAAFTPSGDAGDAEPEQDKETE